jgi:hypothetical protein
MQAETTWAIAIQDKCGEQQGAVLKCMCELRYGIAVNITPTLNGDAGMHNRRKVY